RCEQIQILQLLAKCLSALKFELILLQEFEHVLHIGRPLAITAEQSLAAAALIESRKGLVNAKRERLALVAGEKNKGIAAHERRDVLSLPAALLGDVQILVIANAQDSGRQHHVSGPPEDDGVFQRRARKLPRHQGHRVDVSAEYIIGPHFNGPVAMPSAGHGDRSLIYHELHGQCLTSRVPPAPSVIPRPRSQDSYSSDD